jgi:hypothetical protein
LFPPCLGWSFAVFFFPFRGGGKLDRRHFRLSGEFQSQVTLFGKIEFGGNDACGKGFNQSIQPADKAVVAVTGLADILSNFVGVVLRIKKIDICLQIRVCLGQCR